MPALVVEDTADIAQLIRLHLEDLGLRGKVEADLANPVENALRYTPQGGVIELAAVQSDGGITLMVSDSGGGIAAADLERVFERFFQSTQSREGQTHAGLGLAIVKRVAELHNGQVAVHNRTGSGACFTLWLPLAAS